MKPDNDTESEEFTNRTSAGEERPPTPYEQAREAAQDDVGAKALANMVFGLPGVYHAEPQGLDEPWRDTQIQVNFDDGKYRAPAEVLDVMRTAGWKADRITFERNRVTFVERGSE